VYIKLIAHFGLAVIAWEHLTVCLSNLQISHFLNENIASGQ